MAPLVIRGEISERHLVGTDRDRVPTCKVFVRNVVMLFLYLYRVFKNKESLYFDSPAKTDVVRRFPTSAKVFVSALVGNRIRKRQPHASPSATEVPYILVYMRWDEESLGLIMVW